MHYGWTTLEAERAFDRATAARRRARLSLRRGEPRLPVHDAPVPHSSARTSTRTIPLDAVAFTVEPGRAQEFDGQFRPARRTRERWLRLWVAEYLGVALPPITVVRVADRYAVRDGHHRVSVARARGAVAIDAIVVGE